MIRKLLFALAVLCLSACSAVRTPPPKFETGAFPPIGERTTVHVGDVMATSYDFLARSTAVLKEDLPGGFWAGRNALSAGIVLHLAVASGEQVYCEQSHRTGSACLKDTNEDGMFDRAYTFNVYGLLVNGRDIPPTAYNASNRSILDGFKYELIYQGVSNDVVRVAYREYSESLARPAFSQDLTYTLEPGGQTRIQFRKLSMNIHHADNNEVAYTVLTGL